MSKTYACVISPDISRDKAALVAVARLFAHSIEVITEGVLFDVSGLERLIGKPDLIARKILGEMRRQNVSGSLAVADTVDTAKLLARQNGGLSHTAQSPEAFDQLPLADLNIERDTLNVFTDLGLRSVKDLLAVPHDDLVGRYGKQFVDVIDVLEQKGRSFVTPNVKENRALWKYDLDKPVEDFEQLIFLLNHGLEKLFAEVEHCGFSTEHLDISFRLCGSLRVSKGVTSNTATTKSYEIKTSFPTLERAFWLKFINLRISLDPPEALIKGVDVTAHFAKVRPAQRGLYAASRPEPENLLLTVNKLKKLVGQENVGTPKLLNNRLTEPFILDAEGMPDVATPIAGQPVKTPTNSTGAIALTYFRPPIPAEVLVRDGRLIFTRTRLFAGHIVNMSGVWKGNSHWWDKSWKTLEWDIEIEDNGVYRLGKVGEEWFLVGEYD